MVTLDELVDGHLYFYIFNGVPFIGYFSEENIGGFKEKTIIEVWWHCDHIYEPESFDVEIISDHAIFLKDLGCNAFEEYFIPELRDEFPEYFI